MKTSEWKFKSLEGKFDGIGSYESIKLRDGKAITDVLNNPSKRFYEFYYEHFFHSPARGVEKLEKLLNEIR